MEQRPVFELMVLAGAALLIGAVVVLWVAGAASTALTGGDWNVDASGAFSGALALAVEGGSPSRAYKQPLAGPGWLFWLCASTLIVVAVGCVVAAVSFVSRRDWGLEKRRRLGSSPEAALATRRELKPLHVEYPVEHRFLLGKSGRQLLATENRALTGHGRRHGPLVHRLDRGAVMLMGPSRVGKSTAALSGILEWTLGPVVMCSVKDDLLAPTLPQRRRLGEVAVFDPTGDLSASYEARAAEGKAPAGWDERLVVGWSPIGSISNIDDAQRAARMICEAAPKAGVEGGDFWAAQVEILLSGLFYVASQVHGKSMADVVGWVLRKEYPTAQNPKVEPKVLLDQLLARPEQSIKVNAGHAGDYLAAVWGQEPKTMSSIYATANSTIWAWTTESLQQSATGESVDLEWLLSGTNTLYLCAPPQDQKRLAVVYGGMVNTLLEDCFRYVSRHGTIEPPLLVVLDEAGNMPLERLPQFTSTVAGLGVQLVTLWQDLDQIKVAYGESANTVTNNHLTKVFFPAMSSAEGLGYIRTLAGDEEVTTVQQTQDVGAVVGGSRQMGSQRVSLVPENVARMMRPGDALMFHGTLPPAHIRTVPWYAERRFKTQQSWDDEDDGDTGIPNSLGQGQSGAPSLEAMMAAQAKAAGVEVTNGDSADDGSGADEAPKPPMRKGPSLLEIADMDEPVASEPPRDVRATRAAGGARVVRRSEPGSWSIPERTQRRRRGPAGPAADGD